MVLMFFSLQDQLNAIASSLGSIRAQQDEKWRDVEQRWARERDHHKSPEAASAADLWLTRADLSRLQSEVATHVVELSRMKIRCEQNDKVRGRCNNFASFRQVFGIPLFLQSLEHVMGSLQSIGSTLSTIQRQIRTSHHDVHVHRPLTAPSQGVMMGFSYPSHRSPDPVSISSALPAPVGTVASGHGSGGMNAPRSPGCGPRLVDNSSRTHLHQHPEPFSVQHRHDRDPDAGQSEAQQPAMPTRFDVQSQTEQRVLHESSYAPAGVRTHATGTSPLADDTISPPTSDDGIALARARRYDDKPYVLAKSDAAVQTLRDNRLTGTGKSMPQRYTSHSTQTSVVVPSAHPASGENSDVVSPVPLSDSVADMINAAKAVTSSHHVASVSVDAVSPPDIPIAVPAQQHESRRGRYVSSRTVDVLPVATTTPSAIPSHHVTSSRRHRSSSSHHRPAVPTGSHITPHWITCRCRSCSRSIAVYEDEERLLRQRVRATVDKKLAGK